MLRSLLILGNEHVLRPFDLKIVRRSRVPLSADEPAPGVGGRRIAFFHTPKCGGTSVHTWLATAFGGPAGLDPIAAEAAARNIGATGLEFREALLAYFVQRRDARFISGHYSYSGRAFAGHEDEFDLITILRNPIDRLLSQYYYNRFRDQRNHFPIDSELSDWLQTNQARAAGMVFTKMFVGDAAVAKDLDKCGRGSDTRAAVSTAIANLGRFTIVGMLEDLDGFEKEIKSRYGIRSSIGHLRKSPKAGYPKFADQPMSIQDRIRELCEEDMEIYETFSTRRQTERAFSPASLLAESGT